MVLQYKFDLWSEPFTQGNTQTTTVKLLVHNLTLLFQAKANYLHFQSRLLQIITSITILLN